MDEITLTVTRDSETGWLIATWDEADGSGGIVTQGRDLSDLENQVRDAVSVHFDDGQAPARIRLHFVEDPILLSA